MQQPELQADSATALALCVSVPSEFVLFSFSLSHILSSPEGSGLEGSRFVMALLVQGRADEQLTPGDYNVLRSLSSEAPLCIQMLCLRVSVFFFKLF